MTEIYRVKIRQVQLRNAAYFDYFPFDNIYLVPKEKAGDVVPRLFRYCLVMDITDPIKTALQKIQIQKQRELKIRRDDESYAWRNLKTTEEINKSMEFLSTGEWIGIVPTYAITSPKQEGRPQLQYIITYAIKAIHNRFTTLPKITLHTPKRTLPALCAICKHVAEYYQNTCAPATYKCKSNIFLNDLELTDSNETAVATSIEQAGAVE